MKRAILVPLPHAPEPEAAFRLLAGDAHPFFLDSALRGPEMGRWSIVGSRPFLTLHSRGPQLTLSWGGRIERRQGNPFAEVRRLLRAWPLPASAEVPFCGGAVGYLGYDLCHFVERLPQRAIDDLPLPEMHLAFHDTALVYDHVEQRAWLVAAEPGLPGRASAAQRLGELAERLRGSVGVWECGGVGGTATGPQTTDHGPRRAREGGGSPWSATPPHSRSDVRCNFTRAEYLGALQRCKDYIAAGDIFQVNLSRRFETELDISPQELYLRLRRINPAPMAAYLGLEEDAAVVSASPELFLRVDGRRVVTRPIKGTRPRGCDAAEDAALARELLDSEKDAAELAMIVDLERNDLGRVCEYGTVRVTQPRALESFPTVHHLVATVEGRLHARHDLVDLLRASFPGGSITGAPKVRAMQIIDELEPARRSVYTGAIGWLGFDGSACLNIAIRTILTAGGRAWFQAGGGIVADSIPEAEFDETTHKARALFDALA